MKRGVPPAWIRRPISIAAVIVAGVLLPIAFPVGLILGSVVDVIRRDSGMRWMRTVLFVGLLIVFELAGLVAIFFIWLSSPLGYRMDKPRIQNTCSRLMNWWAGRLLFAITLAIPIQIDRSMLDDELLAGNAIMIGRHRSLLDAVLPAGILGPLGYTTLYTLKEDLRWEPNIDLVGHIMGHRFVTRSPDNLAAELAPIRKLGERVDENSVAVIFPEGTFFTEQRKARIVRSLEQRDPTHADAARNMNYLLAPHPAGTLALLEGAKTADVIVIGHIGFEAFGSIGQIFGEIGKSHDVEIMAWRIRRSEIPKQHDDRIDWLFDTWVALDEWITDRHAEEVFATPAPRVGLGHD